MAMWHTDLSSTVLETYITHLRVLEFSTYPTSPPPPQARNLQTEKPRVIIVAVRKSGRVRVHKTKENVNGTFSIGKTWNLDDLSAIESYTGPNVSPDHRQWAGDNGFLVTMGKPYYWESQTDREKKFFIASLIKIYGKYTGGRVPTLSNFDQRELDQVLGGATRRAPSAQPTPNQATPSPNRPPPSPGRPPVPPSPGRPALPHPPPDPGLKSVASYDGGIASDYTRTPSRSPLPPNGNSSPASLAPSVDSTRNLRSQDASLRQRLAFNNRSQDSVSNAYRSGDESLRPRSRGRPSGTSPYSTNAPEPPPPSALAPAFVPTPNTSTEKPPERKRPPMDPLRPVGLPPDDGLVPAPLISTNLRREQSQEPSRDLVEPSSPVAPPPRSVERMSPRNQSLRAQLTEASPPIDEIAAKPMDPPPRLDTSTAGLVSSTNGADTDSPTVPISAPTPSDTPVDSPVSPEEEHRPGLGPMIRAKKPKNELAGALWKAAAAASAFKPRAGGAGEKLLKAAKKQTNEPDGITAVVPAPRRPEPEKKPESRPVTPEVPEVKVSRPDTSRPSSMQNVAKAEPEAEPKKTTEPELQDERKRSIVVGNDLKYLATLGVDPSILDNKTSQFTDWLDFFSWVPGDKMRSLNFEEMKVDIERELNKAQAGGWLARFQEEDERVDAIKSGINSAMEECEELDNLLTLYGVELSVSSPLAVSAL